MTARFLLIVLLACFPVGLSAQSEVMETGRWNDRFFVYCADAPGFITPNHPLGKLYAENNAGFIDRDLRVVIALPANAVEFHNRTKSKAVIFKILKADHGEIYAALSCTPGRYILMGKDGTVKKRWDSLPSSEELFAIIDAMPMRQQEMRQRK